MMIYHGGAPVLGLRVCGLRFHDNYSQVHSDLGESSGYICI